MRLRPHLQLLIRYQPTTTLMLIHSLKSSIANKPNSLTIRKETKKGRKNKLSTHLRRKRARSRIRDRRLKTSRLRFRSGFNRGERIFLQGKLLNRNKSKRSRKSSKAS